MSYGLHEILTAIHLMGLLSKTFGIRETIHYLVTQCKIELEISQIVVHRIFALSAGSLLPYFSGSRSLYSLKLQCTLGYAIHHGTEVNGLHKQEWPD